jgi:hypothetical protein
MVCNNCGNEDNSSTKVSVQIVGNVLLTTVAGEIKIYPVKQSVTKNEKNPDIKKLVKEVFDKIIKNVPKNLFPGHKHVFNPTFIANLIISMNKETKIIPIHIVPPISQHIVNNNNNKSKAATLSTTKENSSSSTIKNILSNSSNHLLTSTTCPPTYIFSAYYNRCVRPSWND